MGNTVTDNDAPTRNENTDDAELAGYHDNPEHRAD